MTKLSPQHKIFCREYVANGFNAAKAYRIAYNVEQDGNAGSRLLRNKIIQEEIDKEMKARCDELLINERKVLLKLSEMAFAEPGDENYTPSIQLKALDLLQKQLGLQTKNIKADVETTQTIKITIDEEEE